MSGTVQTVGQQTFATSLSDFNTTSFIFQQMLMRVRTASAVKVVSCSNAGAVAPVGTVSVMPLVNQVDGAGNATPHGVIYNIPYFRLQSGVNAIIIDPQAGDIGLLVVCDRDTSSVKASKAQSNPGSRRKYDFADGFYFGGYLNAVPTNYVQFVNGQVNVVATNSVSITAPTTTIMGNLNVTGAVVAGSGGGDQVNLQTHKHPTAPSGAPSSPTPGT
jgi:hypothetical protein